MYKEYLEHFKPGISPEIEKFATEKVFLHSRYIFTWRKSNKQYGYCTHCHSEFKTRLYHNEIVECPVCKSKCVVKASGRGHKYLVDDAYFIYYEKSAKNPEAIVARGILAVRDYSGDFRSVKTKYLTTALYIFELGQSIMLTNYGYYSMAKTMQQWGGWEKRKSIFSMLEQASAGNKKILYASLDNIEAAVKDTPFRYSTWEQYVYGYDMVQFFGLYSKYPCIEYLTKLGFKDLVDAKLLGNNTYGAINWRGKTLFKVLRLTKKDINQFKALNIDISPLFLRLYQITQKDGSNMSIEEIKEIMNAHYYTNDFITVLKHTSLRRADNYINKQLTIDEDQANKSLKTFIRHYYMKSQVARTWIDYVADCKKLQMDLSSDSVLFPRDLYRAHQNTIKQVKIKADKEMNEKIKAKLKRLDKKYCFEYQGLLIRPAQSTDELIAEGKALHHCVGTYSDKYAKGKTVLLFIRETRKPNKPYFTLELREQAIVQCHGKNNCLPDKRINKFIEAFKTSKLQPKKTRVKIAVPA
ncbi:MAG: PcfJ domain-containing protein [Syntrophomonas sp.]